MEDVTGQKIVDLLVEIKELLQKQPVSAQGNAAEGHARRYQNEDGKWVYELPKGKEPRKCKYCDEEIYWVKSKNGKNVPCNKDGECHYETCPDKQDNKKPFVPIPATSVTEGEVPF